MKYFSYKAVDESGLISRGSMAALNAADLDARLSRSHLELISYRQSLIASLRRLTAGAQSWSRRELIDFTFHLEQLLTAGVPLLEALQEFRDSAETPRLASVASQLVDAIDNGKYLSEACAAQPAIFGKMFVSMLQVGEQSGNLDKVLMDLGELLKWHDETLSRIQRVMIYPSFVAVVLLLVIVFVMTWLVPGLMSFVVSTGNDLPWHTKALISTSAVVSQYWLILMVAFVALAVFSRLAIAANRELKIRWDGVLLRIPLFGPVLYKIKLARFSRCASLMYGSGISLIDTLRLGEGVVDNLVLSNSLGEIRSRIVDGQTVSDSFSDSSVFPPIFARMMRVGENTGAMDIAFNQTGYFYDRESRESIERLEQFIGPAMIIAVGSIMMWVVVSVIGPIYDLVFSMSGQF